MYLSSHPQWDMMGFSIKHVHLSLVDFESDFKSGRHCWDGDPQSMQFSETQFRMESDPVKKASVYRYQYLIKIYRYLYISINGTK